MAVVPGDRCTGMAQAAAWGVGRVAAAEHPALALRLLDLPSTDLDDVVERVMAELLADDRDEPQVAWRDGARYALRLARAGDHDGLALPDGPYQLVLEEAGRLDGLRLDEQPELCARTRRGADRRPGHRPELPRRAHRPGHVRRR